MNIDEIEKVVGDIPVDLADLLAELPLQEYLRVVGQSADMRYKAMKATSSRASYMYEIAGICRRFIKLLKR